MKKKPSESFDLEEYLKKGVEKTVLSIAKASVFHPSQAAFAAGFALAAKKAGSKRKALAAEGKHVPPFLICSITSACNLRCAGCYARNLSMCSDAAAKDDLDAETWDRVFTEAEELGVSFILLAGGEPMLRRDVIEKTAEHKGILFAVFTNGTAVKDDDVAFFAAHRNVIPVISLEGDRKFTDARRGAGVYDAVDALAGRLRARGIAFAASVTVTTKNLREVTSQEFAASLGERGYRGAIFVEYVPTDDPASPLAMGDPERALLDERIGELRARNESMIFISFPGDEKSSGGCLAAGRGFFHVNPKGGAEPCPFSPYSDVSVKDHTLSEVLESKLFVFLREGGYLAEEHRGGCVLFAKRGEVKALLDNKEED